MDRGLSFILPGVERRDNCLKRLHAVAGGRLCKEWDGESIPVIVGNLHGALEIQQECRKTNRPYVLIDHGYFNRDINLTWARFCVNNYHCTDWRDSDRKTPAIAPYRIGNHIVVIPPAPMIQTLYGAENWLDEAIEQIKKHTDRKIIVKHKHEGELSKYLAKAHALVSFGSVSEVEAAIQGIPVFTSPFSPAVPISQDLSQIETPSYPDRGQWLRSLAAAEWHKDEMNQCWERLEWQLRHTQNYRQR